MPLYSRGYQNSAIHEIEWQVEEGDTFTWVVLKTSDNFNLLPLNSRYTLTINTIRIVSSVGGENISTFVNATLTRYNSGDKSTTVLLDNSLYLSYTETLYENDSSISQFTIDQGFVLPSKGYEGFYDGFTWFFFSYTYDFDAVGWGLNEEGEFGFSAYNLSNHLICSWDFNKDFVTDTLTFYNTSDPYNPVILYELILSSRAGKNESISFGYFFSLPIIISFATIVYLTDKKLKSLKTKE